MPYLPPTACAPAALARLRGALENAGYTEARVSALLGSTEFPVPGSPIAGRTLARARGQDAFSLLARLFLLNRPLEESLARRALAPLTPEDLVALRMARIEGGRLVPRVALLALDDIFLACDLPARLGGAAFPEVVNGPTDTTAALERFTLRRAARATLDLGTGCGFLALLAKRWSERAVGADVNARALEFAAFNAALNGLEAEWRCGDLFGAVAGETFDLIVSNPPFLITPSRRLVYRDGGMEGDAFARRVVREAPPFLAEQGFLQMIFEWVHPAGEDWRARLEAWFEDCGCDVWIVRNATTDPVRYAEMHIAGTEAPGDTEPTFREWLGYYRERGFEAISSGFVAMRRRSARSHWFAIEDLPHSMPAGFGERVLRRFAAHDLVSRGESALLDAPLRVAPGVTLVRLGSFDGGLRMDRRELKVDPALPYAVGIDVGIEQFLARLTGEAPLGQVIRELARQAGTDADALAPQVLPFVRGLLEQGLLVMDNRAQAHASR